jgi:hypothetical protein
VHNRFFLHKRRCKISAIRRKIGDTPRDTYNNVHNALFHKLFWHRYAVSHSRSDLGLVHDGRGINDQLARYPTFTVTLTVSKIPDARGRPSTLTWFPPIYFDIFLSSGSSAGFHAAAAAVNSYKIVITSLSLRRTYPERTLTQGLQGACTLLYCQRDFRLFRSYQSNFSGRTRISMGYTRSVPDS